MEGYLRVLAGPSGEEEGGGGGGAAWWECRGTADGLPAPFYFVLEGPRLFQGLPPGHEGGQEDSPSAGMPDRVERLVLTSETRVAMAEPPQDDSHCLEFVVEEDGDDSSRRGRVWRFGVVEEPEDCHAWVFSLQVAVSRLRPRRSWLAGKVALDPRYVEVARLGSGSQGEVLRARDSISGKEVALKLTHHLFRSPFFLPPDLGGGGGQRVPLDVLLDAQRIAREIRILRQLDHPCVVKLYGVEPPLHREFESVVQVLELGEISLHRMIHNGVAYGPEHVRAFLYQLLCGVQYLHSMGIAHRDLAPKNVVVNQRCDLKIVDLGLARVVQGGHGQADVTLTKEVATLHYRSPEVIVTEGEYDEAMDLWSVGCILAELANRHVLFEAHTLPQLLLMVLGVTGYPSEADLGFMSNQSAKDFIKTLPAEARGPPRPMAQVAPSLGPEAQDLLGRLLVFDPNKRASAPEALQLAYFHGYRDEAWEGRGRPGDIEWGDIDDTPALPADVRVWLLEDMVAMGETGLRPMLEECRDEKRRARTPPQQQRQQHQRKKSSKTSATNGLLLSTGGAQQQDGSGDPHGQSAAERPISAAGVVTGEEGAAPTARSNVGGSSSSNSAAASDLLVTAGHER